MRDVSATPVGGTILTRACRITLALAAAALAFVGVRLFTGLGAVTAMNDGFAWGLWKPLNVVTFTGIGAGALGLALVVHVAGRQRYRPLIRSAVLVGAVSYTLAGFSVLVDLGRWWSVWGLFVPPWWNLRSVLLEVALCVMAYCAMLWIEVVPALLERRREGTTPLARFASRVLRALDRAFPALLAVAVVLPLMHQSSLGSLFLVTPTKLHPLWYSAWLPALFLLSCVSMGFGAVIVVDTLTALAWRRVQDVRLLTSLSLVMAGVSLAFVALRVGAVALAGELGHVTGWLGVLFLGEVFLFAYPAIRVLSRRYRENPGLLFWAAQLAVAAGALYRVDVYLGAFEPGGGFAYFPSLGEILFTVGLGAAGVALYVAIAKRFAILPGVRTDGRPAAPERIVARAASARDQG